MVACILTGCGPSYHWSKAHPLYRQVPYSTLSITGTNNAFILTRSKWFAKKLEVAPESAQVQLTSFSRQAFLDEIWGLSDQAFEEGGVDKKPGLDEILAWLKEQGIPRAVASGSKLVQVHHHLALLGLDDKFTMAISGFDIENSKPAPDIFLKAARELGTDPARTVVLEDSSNGIRAAHAGGFIPIMVPDHESPEEAHGLYRYVCKDLFEVRDLLASGAV